MPATLASPLRRGAATLRDRAWKESEMRRFAPSVLVALLIVIAESRAQTTPPPPIPLGPPLTLPATLSGTNIDLNFAANSTVGVRLTNLVHHEGGNFTFVNDPAGVGRDWRLW